jgi:hypothetical protein
MPFSDTGLENIRESGSAVSPLQKNRRSSQDRDLDLIFTLNPERVFFLPVSRKGVPSWSWSGVGPKV